MESEAIASVFIFSLLLGRLVMISLAYAALQRWVTAEPRQRCRLRSRGSTASSLTPRDRGLRLAARALSFILPLPALVIPAAAQDVPAWLDERMEVETPEGESQTAWGGWLEVPVRHEAPEGPTWKLRVVLLPAKGAATQPPVVYLAGGPGDSGTGAVRNEDLWDQFAAIRASADVYLLDQRGAGRSEPGTRCDPSIPMTPATFANHGEMLKREIRILKDCAREVSAQGVDLGALDAHQSALDLQVLRDAIGTRRVSLLGFSYGTHLALTAMRQIPEVIHRVVLVGVEGPDHTFKLPSTLDAQIFRLGALTAEDPVVGEDVPDLSGLLARTLHRLDARPIPVTVDGPEDSEVTVPVSGDVLRLLLRLDIGDGADFPAFPAMLAELERGDTRILRSFLGRRYRGFSGRIRIMPDLIDCASGATPTRLQRILDERPRSFIAEATDLLHPEACLAFDDPDPRPGHRSPIFSRLPTLLVSGTLDANTPPFQAEEVRWGLPAAEHVVVEYASHQDHFDDPRVRQVIASFLIGEHVESQFLPSPRPRFVPVWPPTDAGEPSGWSEPLALEVVERDGDLQLARYDPGAGTFTMEGWGSEGRVVERVGYRGALFLRIHFERYDLSVRARLDRSEEGITGVWWIDNRPEGTFRSRSGSTETPLGNQPQSRGVPP